MGRSEINNGEWYVILSDYEVVFIFSYLAKWIEGGTCGSETLQSFLPHIKSSITHYVPGCIELDLAGCLQSKVELRIVLSLLDRLKKELESMGDRIPSDWSKNFISRKNEFYPGGGSTQRLIQAVGMIKRLVANPNSLVVATVIKLGNREISIMNGPWVIMMGFVIRRGREEFANDSSFIHFSRVWEYTIRKKGGWFRYGVMGSLGINFEEFLEGARQFEQLGFLLTVMKEEVSAFSGSTSPSWTLQYDWLICKKHLLTFEAKAFASDIEEFRNLLKEYELICAFQGRS